MKLELFGSMDAPLAPVEFVGNGPRGRRLVGPIVGARLEGPYVNATQRGTSAADWLLMSADGTTIIDVRIAWRTDDGAFLYLTYRGRADWSAGIGARPVYSALHFDTEDVRYRWLTKRIIVGKGHVQLDRGGYELFMLD